MTTSAWEPTTSSDTPTAHDLACALAAHLDPAAAPRDVIVSFSARNQAPIEFRHRGRGGPVTGIAQELHAHLFGLPEDEAPIPTALDALLQATHTAASPEQRTAILHQLADQLRNATEIIQRHQYEAQWDRLPDDIAAQLRHAHDQTRQVAETLDRVAPAFSSPPTTPSRRPPREPHNRAVAPTTSPTPPAGRRR
ncbi:hypothetical protein [Streptomyces niveus]|uniref:Uncharacterized protein n=1 Tax=Streptomyces niveus TaxID=193462 RepID=A0A1U9R0Y2_STRNV|nr:hypothetical protein [Streptomyces niveus]AQU70156.1 hypothetical protein BBN63_32250 [Streptomyces niveus]